MVGLPGPFNLPGPQVVVKSDQYGRNIHTVICAGGVCGEGEGEFDQSGMGRSFV